MKWDKLTRLPRWAFFVFGLLLGALVLLGIRFAAYQPEHVHYHANFAVYINGQREQFKQPQYYQEVAICNASNGITMPEQRVHMHDNINNVVHVHDHAVTWGQFFNNLGWTIGPDFIATDKGAKYIASGNDKLNIIIDGQDYTDLTSIANTVIKDDSHVLISFGNIDKQTLQQEYKSVPDTARKYDATKDTGVCGANETPTFKDRLQHLL